MSFVTTAGIVGRLGELGALSGEALVPALQPVVGCQGCGAAEFEDGVCSYCRRPRFHRDDVARAGAHLTEVA